MVDYKMCCVCSDTRLNDEPLILCTYCQRRHHGYCAKVVDQAFAGAMINSCRECNIPDSLSGIRLYGQPRTIDNRSAVSGYSFLKDIQARMRRAQERITLTSLEQMVADSERSATSPLADTAPLIEERDAQADAIPESSSRASDTHGATAESSTVHDPSSHGSNLNRYDATPSGLSSNHQHDSKTSPSSATRERP